MCLPPHRGSSGHDDRTLNEDARPRRGGGVYGGRDGGYGSRNEGGGYGSRNEGRYGSRNESGGRWERDRAPQPDRQDRYGGERQRWQESRDDRWAPDAAPERKAPARGPLEGRVGPRNSERTLEGDVEYGARGRWGGGDTGPEERPAYGGGTRGGREDRGMRGGARDRFGEHDDRTEEAAPGWRHGGGGGRSRDSGEGWRGGPARVGFGSRGGGRGRLGRFGEHDDRDAYEPAGPLGDAPYSRGFGGPNRWSQHDDRGGPEPDGAFGGGGGRAGGSRRRSRSRSPPAVGRWGHDGFQVGSGEGVQARCADEQLRTHGP